MKFDVLVGLQYGSEAKGLIANHLATFNKYDACVTVNSCQSGHTFYHDGQKVVNRQLPTAFPHTKAICIGAGALIKPHVLKEEIESLESLGFNIRDRLYIDRHACVIPDDAGEKEKELVKEIGSTGEGVGYAMSERVWRRADLVKNQKEFFSQFGSIVDVSDLLAIFNNVLLEGTQGTFLSLLHGEYPHVTSRDTLTGSLIAGCGLNIRNLNDIYGICRTYPIRVGSVKKTSGPMHKEIDWNIIQERSGYEEDISEKTTVTGRTRRVSEFNTKQIIKGIELNGVNKLCVTFLNYLNSKDEKVNRMDLLSDESMEFISNLNNNIKNVNAEVDIVSTNKYGAFHV